MIYNKIFILISIFINIVENIPLNKTDSMKETQHRHLDHGDISFVAFGVYFGIIISSFAVLLLLCQALRGRTGGGGRGNHKKFLRN